MSDNGNISEILVVETKFSNHISSVVSQLKLGTRLDECELLLKMIYGMDVCVAGCIEECVIGEKSCFVVGIRGMSFTYKKNKWGERYEPCGTPA